MKYYLIVLLIAIAWAIKAFLGYYILTWVVKYLMPWWYWLRGIRRDKQGEPEFAAVLKSIGTAARNSEASAANAAAAADLLYNTGGVRDTTTLCAGIAQCADMPLDAIEREFGAQTAAVVRQARERLQTPVAADGTPPEALADVELAVRQVQLVSLTIAVTRLGATGAVEQRREQLDHVLKLLKPLRGTNESLEALFEQQHSKVKSTLS